MELKYLSAGILVSLLFISGFALFIGNFTTSEAGLTMTTVDSKFEGNLSKVYDAIEEVNSYDSQLASDEDESSGGSWSWNPLDWQIFRAFNIIKGFRNLVKIPKEILLAIPDLFDLHPIYSWVGIALIISFIIFAIVTAFTKSGRL